MGQRGPSKRFLMVKPGDTNWSVTTSLKEEVSLMESEGCREMCPAHPSNSYNHQTGSVSWTTKARKGKYEILLRCSSHDGVHSHWLFKKGREGKRGREEIANAIWKADDASAPLASLLDFEEQKEAAFWHPQAASSAAHLMDQMFIQWLIAQAREDKWSKEEVATIVLRKNSSNWLILATLDKEIQKEAALFNRAKTCNAIPYMDHDFLQWFYQEVCKGEGAWKLLIEDVDGRTIISSRIKAGKFLR